MPNVKSNVRGVIFAKLSQFVFKSIFGFNMPDKRREELCEWKQISTETELKEWVINYISLL